jgi:hypothetical protein
MKKMCFLTEIAEYRLTNHDCNKGLEKDKNRYQYNNNIMY